MQQLWFLATPTQQWLRTVLPTSACILNIQVWLSIRFAVQSLQNTEMLIDSSTFRMNLFFNAISSSPQCVVKKKRNQILHIYIHFFLNPKCQTVKKALENLSNKIYFPQWRFLFRWLTKLDSTSLHTCVWMCVCMCVN